MNYILKCIFVAAIALSINACTKKDQKLKFGVNKSETIVVNLQTEPPSLDWHKAVDTTSHEITMNIMDGLTAFDFDDPDLKVVPALATKWESDKSATKWTFELRPDVKWTDGVEFEAKQIVDAWERLLNPKTAGEYAYFLFGIKNAQDYNSGKLKDFSKVGVKADGKYKVVVELNSPMSFFPSLLAHHSTFPIRLDVVKKFGEAWVNPGNLVSLGAFRLKEWSHDEAILLERNDNYYGEKAKVKYVLGRMITEQSSAVNAFDAGELDTIPELPSNDISILKNRSEYRSKPNLALFYYGFNTKVAPFDDINFRKAVVHAVDREEVVKLLNKGDIAAQTWVPEGMLGYDPNIGLKFDPQLAKDYLKKSGYTDPTKVPRISITYNTNENHKKVAENLQAQLKRNLGIDVEIQNEEWKVYLSKLKTKKGYTIYRMGWVADYPDPDNFLNNMTKASANNHTNWSSPEFDKLIQQGVSEFDVQKRKEIYAKAQRIMQEEAAVVLPLYYQSRQNLVNSRVKGFSMNVLDQKVYKKVSLE